MGNCFAETSFLNFTPHFWASRLLHSITTLTSIRHQVNVDKAFVAKKKSLIEGSEEAPSSGRKEQRAPGAAQVRKHYKWLGSRNPVHRSSIYLSSTPSILARFFPIAIRLLVSFSGALFSKLQDHYHRLLITLEYVPRSGDFSSTVLGLFRNISAGTPKSLV
jgi:hypothetical protein